MLDTFVDTKEKVFSGPSQRLAKIFGQLVNLTYSHQHLKLQFGSLNQAPCQVESVY